MCNSDIDSQLLFITLFLSIILSELLYWLYTHRTELTMIIYQVGVIFRDIRSYTNRLYFKAGFECQLQYNITLTKSRKANTFINKASGQHTVSSPIMVLIDKLPLIPAQYVVPDKLQCSHFFPCRLPMLVTEFWELNPTACPR